MSFERVRFFSSLLSIVSFGTIINFIASLLRNNDSFTFLSSIFVMLSTFLLFSWFSLYGSWISRSRRAVFNEHNVMVTYQPRALTHGHLFVPEPPTPVPNSDGNGGTPSFRKSRDEHYKDEFVLAQKLAKEKEMAPKLVLKKEPVSMRIEFEDDTSSDSPASPKSTDTSRSL